MTLFNFIISAKSSLTKYCILFSFIVSLFVTNQSFAQKVFHSQNKALSHSVLKSKSNENNQLPKNKLNVIVLDFKALNIKNYNEKLIAKTAPYLLEKRIGEISSIDVIPQEKWQPLLGDNLSLTDGHDLKKLQKILKNKIIYQAVFGGQIVKLTEKCLGGGLLILGVRKIQYDCIVKFYMKSVSNFSTLFSWTEKSKIIDKSIGFKIHKIKLSLPAVNNLMKPMLDNIILQLLNVSFKSDLFKPNKSITQHPQLKK